MTVLTRLRAWLWPPVPGVATIARRMEEADAETARWRDAYLELARFVESGGARWSASPAMCWCGIPAHGHGLCPAHYHRMRRAILHETIANDTGSAGEVM